MDLSLVGKNALVCGSSKGIGKATALELATLGANITAVARSEDLLIQLMSSLSRIKNQTHGYIVIDFADHLDLQAKIKKLTEVKTIHILINNTGGPPPGKIIDAIASDFISSIEKHLIANHLITGLIIDGMKKAGYGRIINIISTSVREPIPGLGVSNTTRGAVASWSKTLANELGPDGITVNNILPGFTMTGRLQSILESRAKKEDVSLEELKNQAYESIPLRRFADPNEIAQAVAFLASPAASYISGVSLPVDGGRLKSI